MSESASRGFLGDSSPIDDESVSREPVDLDRLQALAPRYDRPGPRYTSYPTVPAWTEGFDESAHRDALAASDGEDVAVYVHIPFCESLCTYCACNKEIRRDHSVATPYVDDLKKEAEMVAGALGRSRRCAQLAIGGGTPTYLDEDQLERMCDLVDESFPPAESAERSIEIDPRVTRPSQLEVLARRGFNRVSLGVQDFAPQVQKAIRRVQSVEETGHVTTVARELGFTSVNYDLIYGLPFQTVASFDDTLDIVIDLRPDRIALYSYAHVTWVSKQQRGFERGDLPDANRKLAIFSLALRRLLAAGYRYLGLDHFALPGDELCRAQESGDLRRNFMGYTTRAGLDLVGLGASGISELRGAYAQSVRGTTEWSERIRSGRLATLRGWNMSEDDQRRRWLIQHLMCQSEIDPVAYQTTFGEPLEDRVPDLETQLAEFLEDGLLERSDRGYRLTPIGRVLARPVAMTFDAYLPDRADEVPRFSRTI
jgi:oxygen-independent coproporphyrinogen-3 oxidase